MNLPNKLTVSRFALTAAFVALFYAPISNHLSWALLVFSAASFTDYLDGEIARKRNLVTNFGKLMDPLADKVLMTAALVILTVEGQLAAWIVIVILAREFFVTGIRLVAAQTGTVLAAEKLGKHKLVWQVISVLYFLLYLATTEPMFKWLAPAFAWKPFSPGIFGMLTVVMMTGLTIVSGISYFWKNRQLFADA